MSEALMGMPKQRLRAKQASDEAQLKHWVNQTGFGLSVAETPEADQAEWLVLADAENDQPLACLRLVRQLGMRLPRYSYHVGRVVHAAAELGLFCTQRTLLLGNDHTGESELADLAFAPGLPAERQVAYLSALVQAALARIAESPSAYGEVLIVELAGLRDAPGDTPSDGAETASTSPFWRGLGAHFYEGQPSQAQARFGDAWRSHLAALLPRQTLYLSFLSEAAQAAVGQVGAPGLAAAAALAASGFGDAQHVCIDDGGPLWQLRLR
nr:arginine N-succinyltransferase [uncultured Roseateles sp.]